VVTSLLAADSCSYNHFGHDGHLAFRITPADVGLFPDAAQIFGQHLHEHPVLARYWETGDGAARRISDFLSDRQFRSLGLYREFYRPREVNYQLAFGVPSPGHGLIGIAVNRQRRDFSDDEAELLDLLRPHVEQASRIWHPAGYDGLTPRQARIVELVGAGYSDRVIGRELGISTRTVHAHLRNIYRVLDVGSRTEAVARVRDGSLPAAEGIGVRGGLGDHAR